MQWEAMREKLAARLNLIASEQICVEKRG